MGPVLPRSPQHTPSVHAANAAGAHAVTPVARTRADRHSGCPQCGAILRLTPQLAGKQVRCLKCRTVFRLPAS